MMLLEAYDWSLEPRQLMMIVGALLGVVFGIAAQISRFCLRRAVAGDAGSRAQAGSVWLTAFVTAIIGFFVARTLGVVDVADHRYLASDLSVVAIILGGLMFGAGMVLTRGCVSRLTVLGASGNLRALFVITLFAIVAHATLKGVFAPIRTTLSGLTIDLPVTSLFEVPVLAVALVLFGLAGIWKLVQAGKPKAVHLLLGAVIGLLPVLGWATTSVLFFDEFDPLPVQSLAFTLPWTDTLFWLIASSAIPAGFGVGMIGGVIAGAFASATLRGEFELQTFESAPQTLRYSLGAALMGVGGVLAGGCTIGAGLAGSALLSIAALLALVSIIAGGSLARVVVTQSVSVVPAE